MIIYVFDNVFKFDKKALMYPTSHTVHVAHIVIYLMVGPSPFEMGVHQSASKQLNFCMAIYLFIYFFKVLLL